MIKYNTTSKVEPWFGKLHQDLDKSAEYRRIPLLLTDNYVELGQLTALRFLEWVCLNPGGVVALPTGRTPEFFIKWMQYYLTNWDREMKSGILARIGFDPSLKPDFGSLHFFQLDEFFPINPQHERSFTWFVKKYYIDGFGFDPKKVRLINTYEFDDSQKQQLGTVSNLDEVFPDGTIDLSLRVKLPANHQERLKQKTIKLYDTFCQQYEEDIRQLGGLGFFLGGIGPDGHVAFNVRGSSHHSHTRLTNINYETQAAAAADLGGIELVRKKAVITMGLETITFNPDTVAIIIAAGESKAGVVADAVEKVPGLEYPASALQKLTSARFFVTRSAAVKLRMSHETLLSLRKEKKLSDSYAGKILIDEALRNQVSLIELSNMSEDEALAKMPMLATAKALAGKSSRQLAQMTYDALVEKIELGVKIPSNHRILHTGPHHDDIELAYFPLLHHLVRSPNNDNYFVYCTSGFTAVTNFYVNECLSELKTLLASGKLAMFSKAARLHDLRFAHDDITGFLKGIARQDKDIQKYFVATRLARRLFNNINTDNYQKLEAYTDELLGILTGIEPGRKEPEILHLVKGWLREFEAELVWAHFGIGKDRVEHLNLHFYSDDIFPQYPDYELDVLPILNLFERINPSIISLALDPEGSGPDTHYKTLIALADAIDIYVKNHPDLNLRIWGYRNVWSRYEPTDVNRIIPVSLNSFAVLHNMFNSCFVSQKSASFPSFELDGTFSELAQKIWVEQHENLLTLMGKDYFYESPNPMLRRAYGAIYLKDMSYSEFSEHIVSVRRLLKAKEEMERS